MAFTVPFKILSAHCALIVQGEVVPLCNGQFFAKGCGRTFKVWPCSIQNGQINIPGNLPQVLKEIILSFLAHIFSLSIPSLSFLSGTRNRIAISSNPPPTKFVQFFEIRNKSFPNYIINCNKNLLRDLRP